MLQVLFIGRHAPVNTTTALFAFISLILIFTQTLTDGWVLAALGVVIAAIFVSYMVQFTGPRWPTGVMVMIIVFAAFLYSWPIQALLPTYLKTDLHYDADAVADVLFFSGFGAAIGCWVAGFTGDYFGTRKAYWMSLIVSQVLIFPVFLIGGYFQVEKRAAGLGFSYNVGALGGAVAPVLGASLAVHMPLGTALAVLSFALTCVVIVLIGFNTPRLAQRLIHPGALWDSDAVDRVPAGKS